MDMGYSVPEHSVVHPGCSSSSKDCADGIASIPVEVQGELIRKLLEPPVVIPEAQNSSPRKSTVAVESKISYPQLSDGMPELKAAARAGLNH